MSRAIWDDVGEKRYETGVRMGMLYRMDSTGAYTTGVPWNGLTAVNESPSGAEATSLWADDGKYVNLLSAEEFNATIEAYTYPPEFDACNGNAQLTSGVTIGQQSREPFGFCYRTTVGNDVKGENFGYKIHIVYGCQASPSARQYSTINDSPNAITFSWEVKTTAVPVTGAKNTATVEIDSTLFTSEAAKAKLAAFEDIIYGRDPDETQSITELSPRLPLPNEIKTLLAYTA